jgi:hypothetical protein
VYIHKDAVVHVDLTSILQANTFHSENKQADKVKVLDPMPAILARVEERIANLPSDELAKNILLEQLGSLSVNEAFSIADNRAEDGITEVFLKNGVNQSEQPYSVFVDAISRRVNNGLAEGESIESLSNVLDRASQGSTSVHGEVREILSELGKLDHKTENYINRSESYVRFGLEQETAKISETEELFKFDGNSDKALNFTVTTKDGDLIKISLDFNTQKRKSDLTYGKAVSLSYEVEGDINLQEHQAFNALLSAVAQSSDALLNGGEFTDFIGLETFDASQLEGFDLSLASDTHDGLMTKNHYNYSYSHNDETQSVDFTHHAEDGKKGRQLQSSISLNSNIGGVYDEKAIENILSVVEQAENVASNSLKDKKDSDDKSNPIATPFKSGIETFFKTAQRLGDALDNSDQYFDESLKLAKDMFEQLRDHDPRYQGLPTAEKDRISEGFSTLADYQIKYEKNSSPLNTRNESTKKVNQFNLGFDQYTHQKGVTGNNDSTESHIEQTRSHTGEAKKLGGAVARGNIVNDNWKVDEKYKISLLSKDNMVTGLDQERNRDETRDTFTYLGAGQYSRREVKENTNSSSEIRNTEELWLENLSYSSEGYDKLSIYNGRRAEDIDVDQVFGKQYSHQFEQLTLIGDLEKLNEDNGYRSNKMRELNEIDLKMKGEFANTYFKV